MDTLLFWILAGIILVSGLGVVVARNPIHSALALIVNLLTVAAIFAQLGAHFLAAAQIIVYAGAIMVLVLFVLMLLNIKVESPKKSSFISVGLAIVAGIGGFAMLAPSLQRTFAGVYVDGGQQVEGTVKAIGLVLFSRYVFPFEIASILIMAAIVGAVMLAKRRYR